MKSQSTMKKILIVEDEAVVAQDLRQQVAELGYDPVAVTATGEEALVLAEQQRPDLVLMDIKLPGEMDGISAAQVLRKQFAIPVVYLTAYSDAALVQRAKLTEPFGYVIKPFVVRELGIIIEMAFYKHRAEMALRESQERFQRLAETMPDAMVVTQAGRNVFANSAAARLLGAAGPAELVGRETCAMFDPAHRAWVRQQLHRSPAGDQPPAVEKRFVRRDGASLPVEIAASLSTWQGRPALQIIARDITERKQVETRIRKFSQEILIARENERKQVSSGLHHDVGSLAVGVSAHLDAIEADLSSGKSTEALRWVKRTRKLFHKSVAHLKGLAVQLRPPELDVLGLRAALRQQFSQVTKHRGTQIHFRETLGRRRIAGDTATILFRIAQEALTNAITHGQATRVDVNLRASNEEVRLIICNNGRGFDPSKHQPQATSQMGLLVMREMATFAGGIFTIDSGRGKPTTVRVSLPLEKADRLSAKRKPNSLQPKHPKQT